MGSAFIRRSGANPLGLVVCTKTQAPASPPENMIWVPQGGVSIAPQWAMADENPYIQYRDEQLLDGVQTIAGYRKDDGSAATQTASFEVRTYEMMNVEYGADYEYSYGLTASKVQWLAVCEYSVDGVFLRRNTLVDNVTGKSAAGTYTPGSLDVARIELMWKTHGDSGCVVTMTRRNAPYTPDDTPIGSLWIDTGKRFTTVINALRSNRLLVRVGSIRRWYAGAWAGVPGKIWQDGAWKDLPLAQTALYARGDTCTAVTGGWSKVSGTLTMESSHMHLVGSSACVSTAQKIDVTEAAYIEFEVSANSGSAKTIVGIGTTNAYGEYAAQETVPLSLTEYGKVRVNVETLTGEYYAKFQTAAGSVGCDVRSVILVR